MNTIQKSDIDFTKFKVIKDKYNRVIDGVNHGRAVYYNKGLYYKIFHPEYVRLKNFHDAIHTGFYDGLAQIESLIYDGDLVVGYVQKEGTHADRCWGNGMTDGYFDEQLVINAKKYEMFYYDADYSNIVIMDDRISLIDLESVYRFDQAHLMKKHNAVLKGTDRYINNIEKLIGVKNIVFIPNIDLGNNRNASYQYSINSWKRWCDKNDCTLFLLEDLMWPIEDMKITWQRYELFNILESNDISYSQILMVDCDTIIREDTPNFFEMTENKYCGVQNNGCYEWLLRSIDGYSKLFFNNEKIKPWEYINGGFQIVNKSHKSFFGEMLKFYNENKNGLIHAQNEIIRTGSDQTPLNFMLKRHNIEVKILPEAFNLQDPARKNLLYLESWNWWNDTLDNLYNAGYIIHFNAIPKSSLNRASEYWMERYYKYLYEIGKNKNFKKS